jgi:DNA polymerase
MRTLEDLQNNVKNCTDCNLCQSRTQIVFGTGSNNPKLIVVGEAPGEEEDLSGEPFVGKAGEQLNKILKFLNLKREEVYILNSVLCRPQNNRNPTQQELDACRWRFLAQVDLLQCDTILSLGKVATQQILGKPFKGPLKQFFKQDGFNKIKLGNKTYNMMVSWHPSFHLRSPNYSYETSLPHYTFLKTWISNGIK